MKKVILSSIIRIVSFLLICVCLPFIYSKYGVVHPAGGLNAMSLIFTMMFMSSAMGIVYLLLSFIMYRINKENTKLRWRIEAGIIILFLLLSTYIALGVRITSTN
jgi:hypothetical protein